MNSFCREVFHSSTKLVGSSLLYPINRFDEETLPCTGLLDGWTELSLYYCRSFISFIIKSSSSFPTTTLLDLIVSLASSSSTKGVWPNNVCVHTEEEEAVHSEIMPCFAEFLSLRPPLLLVFYSSTADWCGCTNCFTWKRMVGTTYLPQPPPPSLHNNNNGEQGARRRRRSRRPCAALKERN